MFSDEDSNFKGLYFQDRQMVEVFQAYPELLCIDATYKLLNLGLPVYLFLCEDSNGQSEIVGVCLLASEDAVSMKWMLSAFQKHNVKWPDTRVIMADKDIKERDVIKEVFPDVAVLICLFHMLRTFRREITSDKMGITMGQRTKIFKKWLMLPVLMNILNFIGTLKALVIRMWWIILMKAGTRLKKSGFWGLKHHVPVF